MRQYHKWLSVGLLALTPGIASAGALAAPNLKPGQATPSAAARPAKRSRASANQELADKIARALRSSRLDGFDINIDVRDGVVILDGFVTRAEQRHAAAKAARSVPGVAAVNNRLRIEGPVSRARNDQSSTAPSQPAIYQVQPANYQAGNDRQPVIVQTAGYEAGPVGATAYNPQTAPAGNVIYSQPNLPANAVPMYAPNQSSAGAWPYMGPFQPYPQCPLGWRKVTMYWDEGLWKIDFGSRKPWWR